MPAIELSAASSRVIWRYPVVGRKRPLAIHLTYDPRNLSQVARHCHCFSQPSAMLPGVSIALGAPELVPPCILRRRALYDLR